MVEYDRVSFKFFVKFILTLRIANKNFNKADLLHEFFLTQTQINKLREKVENHMSP